MNYELAACRGAPTELFFPKRGESSREAKAVCRECPIRRACLAEALARGEQHGIWGVGRPNAAGAG